MKKGVLEIMKFYTQNNINGIFQNCEEFRKKVKNQQQEYLFVQFLKVYTDLDDIQIQEKSKKTQKKKKDNSELDSINKFILMVDFLVMVQQNSILQSEYQIVNVAYNKFKSDIKNILKDCLKNLRQNFVEYLQVIENFAYALNLFIVHNTDIFNSVYCYKEIQQALQVLINNTYIELNKELIIEFLVNYFNLKYNKNNMENILNFLTNNIIESITQLYKLKLKNKSIQYEIFSQDIWTNKDKNQSFVSIFEKLSNRNIAILLKTYERFLNNQEVLYFATTNNFERLLNFFKQISQNKNKSEYSNFIQENVFQKLIKLITKFLQLIKLLNLSQNQNVLQTINQNQITFLNPKIQFSIIKLVQLQFYYQDYFKNQLKENFISLIQDTQQICNYLQKPQIDYYFTNNNIKNSQNDMIIEKENNILSLLISMNEKNRQKLCYKYLKTLNLSLETLNKNKQIVHLLYTFCRNILQNGYFYKNFSKQIQEQVQFVFQIFNYHLKKLDSIQIKNIQYKYYQFKQFNDIKKELLDFDVKSNSKRQIQQKGTQNQFDEKAFSFQNFQPDQNQLFTKHQIRNEEIYTNNILDSKYNLTFQKAKSVQLSFDDLQKQNKQNLSIHQKQTYEQQQNFNQFQDQTSLDLPKLNLEQLQKIKFIFLKQILIIKLNKSSYFFHIKGLPMIYSHTTKIYVSNTIK